MENIVFYDRIQFAITITFHYLFPQLTMGMALLILYFKTKVYRNAGAHYGRIADFWVRIFAITFVFGVVSGIPMEFQFGTNWAAFSKISGGIVGKTLAMEGMFAFFLESTFLGVMLFGKGRFSEKVQWIAALMVFLGTWLSGYFIIMTNAFMQHPQGYFFDAAGKIQVENLASILFNPWGIWQYMHNMASTVAVASFFMCAVAAYYLLSGRHFEFAKTTLTAGVIAAMASVVILIAPSGVMQAEDIMFKQPEKGAAMEGVFKTEEGTPMILFGLPDTARQTVDSAVKVPYLLSFLTHKDPFKPVTGFDQIPRDRWPDNIPLVFFVYHIMIMLGVAFAGIMGLALFLLWKKRIFTARALLWALMLCWPLPYIATICGWMTTEVGRQPWLVYGLMRTHEGVSPAVPGGATLFTLIGFSFIYFVAGLLYFTLILREIGRGPEEPKKMEA